MEKGAPSPAAHHASDGGEADVGPVAAADITNAPMISPKAATKKRFSSIMRSRSAAGARRESIATTVASSIIEQQFQSIRHLMDEEDEAAPKTAGQWSQRLQSHLKSKFERGPSAVAAAPKLHRNQTWNGNESTELHIEDIQFDPGLGGEGSDPDVLFSKSHQELDTERLQHHHEQGSASLSMLKLENSFTAESMVGGWFASKRRASKTSGNNNNSKTSVVENNSSMELSTREEFFQVVNATNSSDSPHSSKSNIESTQNQFQMPISPTTPRRSLFSKGRPIMAPKLTKQLTDFRLKRKGVGRTSSKDEGESPEAADDDEDGGFSVSTEKLSIHNARISLTDDEDETVTNSDDDTPHRANTKEKQPQKKRHSSARSRKVSNKEGPAGDLRKREVNQELVEWRREKFKDKLAGTTGGTVKRQDTESARAKAKSKASAMMLLASIKHTGASSSGNNDDVLMVEQKSLSAKIKSVGKKPKRMKSANTKKSLALSLASSSKGSKKKSEESDDAGTVLDDLFDDDDSTFFGKSESGINKDASMASPPKPARITRARTASADMVVAPKDMFTSTRTTLSAEISSRPYTNNTERTERSAGSGGGSSRRDLRTSGGSLRGQRTTQVQSQTMRAERTTAVNRGERPGSYRLERTTAGSVRSQRTTESTGSMPKKDDLDSIFKKTAQRQRPKRRASLSSVDDFEKSFQLVDGGFLFGDSDKKDPENEFEADFATTEKASATELFHQSFSIGALLSPSLNNRSNGSSMPIIIPDNAASFLEGSFSLLSTVEEVSKVSRGEKKLKRRKSLPSSSTHSNTVEEDTMRKSRTKSPAPSTGTATPRTSKRKSRRQSRTSELQASIASLQAPDLEIGSTTKDSESGVASGEKDRIMGLAPSPADIKPMARRRGSIGASEKAAAPEVKETTMEKIRMRRRVSHRIERSATTRSSSKKRQGRQASGTKNDETIMWQRRSSAAPGTEQAREQERKPTRRHTRDHMREVKTNDFSHLLRRTKTHDGTTSRTSQDKKHEDAKKSSSRCLTPNSARRMVRRQTIQIDSPPLTPNRKERLRSMRKGDSAMADAIQHVGLDSSVQDETLARDESPARESSGRKITGRGRQTSGESVQKSSRSMYSSDDSELELAPTPKPAAPPMMPEDPMRRFTGTEYELAPTPKPIAPPKMPEDPMRRFTGKNHKASSTRLRPRRHPSADPSIDPSVSSATKRRSTRNRRNTAHEALKQLEGVLTPAPLVDTLKVSPLKKKSSIKSSKQRTSKEKKATSELATVATPSKANRFRCTRSIKEDDSGATTTPPRVSSRSPRTSLAPSSSSKKTRRVKSDDGKGRTPRLRRTKTADGSSNSSRQSPSGQDNQSPTSGSEITGTSDEPHDAITNKRILHGISF